MGSENTKRADALLDELHREGAGRLTIFLGAAPGVGKTYAMLSRAREARRRGMDVVVGIAETHGRVETAELLQGLEVLPRRCITYRGHRLEELDLDAMLARKPAIALVDELAHRNAPGSRHERRWQDVMELLDAGIDVHTTVNIQHLESLNDVVHRITGIRVNETVPDSVFDRLRDIVLVDLPPRELIERLKQGKVYVPEQAARALRAFFSPSNLTALRELTMQAAADRVDSDLRETQTARGVANVPLRRRVLVAIDGRGQSEYLVRMARRLAERRAAPWTVVTVQVEKNRDPDKQHELDRAFALARRLGGDTEVLHDSNVVHAIVGYAEQCSASTLVLGHTRERPVARMFNHTLTQQLLRQGAHFELTIVSSPQARARSRRSLHNAGKWFTRNDMVLAIVATTLATAIGAIAGRWLAQGDLAMIYIVAVILVASRTRMAAAVVAAVLSFLAYNLFFIPPVFTLYISASRGVVTAFLFLAAALIAGRLASRLRAQVLALRAANAYGSALQTLSLQLATAADLGQVMEAGRQALRRKTGADALIHSQGDASLGDSEKALSEKDRAAMDWAIKHQQAAGRFTNTLGHAVWWFLPLTGDTEPAGVIGLRFPEGASRPGAEQQRLIEAMADEIAQAIVRTRLVADLEDARVSGEAERLRSALLSSVSHDLRSPLTSIIGSAESLERYGDTLSRDDRHDLLAAIRQEGERLDRYIQNLLDMTRLGHGDLTLNRDWINVDHLVDSAVSRLQRYQPGARFDLRQPSELAPLWVHPALVEQALFNVMENAAKFSPRNEPVVISVRDVEKSSESGPLHWLCIDVSDRGPGIPEDERRQIFDMFFSVERGDRNRHGDGLGLAITQAVIGAHGGHVEALPGNDGQGTTIRITLPRLSPPEPSS